MKLTARTEITNVKYDVLLTVHLSIILITDKLNAQILVLSSVYFISLHVSSTIMLIITSSKFYYTSSGIITNTCFSVMITDAVQCNFDLLMLETCR